MKIIFYSHTPYAQTGFGTVIKNLVEYFKKEHEIFILPVHGHAGATIHYDGYNILSCPGGLKHSAFWCKRWAKDLKADVVIQHFDVWMLEKGWAKDFPCPVITYAPVDCDPLPRNFVETVKYCRTNVAMSHHAAKLFSVNNISNVYIPHGVDLKLFKKVNNARELLGLPEGFIVGIVATNGSIRKNLGGQMLAFKKFVNKYPNSYLYMHTQPKKTHNEAIDMVDFIEYYNIPNVIFSDPEIYALGYPESYLPIIYSCFDVLLQCTLGEGFGLPILEAQACGVPVIGTNCSAIDEVIGEGGFTVNGMPLFMTYYLSKVMVPDENEIVKGLEYVYKNTYKDELSNRAKLNAEKYNWDNILVKWDELLSCL